MLETDYDYDYDYDDEDDDDCLVAYDPAPAGVRRGVVCNALALLA